MQKLPAPPLRSILRSGARLAQLKFKGEMSTGHTRDRRSWSRGAGPHEELGTQILPTAPPLPERLPEAPFRRETDEFWANLVWRAPPGSILEIYRCLSAFLKVDPNGA